MKFTKIPVDTFSKLQLNAGILVDNFDPASGTIGNLLGATTGGIEFKSNPSFQDYGEDVDNCPNGMKELKKLTGYDPQMSGAFLTCTPSVIKSLIGAADISVSNGSRVVPRQELEAGDFKDLWWIGDYSDVNTGNNAGFLAVHLMSALNTAGFQIKSSKDNKGQMSFEYHGHYSINAQDVVPFEIYCKAGESSATPGISLSAKSVTIAKDTTVTIGAEVVPSDASVTWTSSATAKATVAGGVVTGVAAGSAIITASITVDGVAYTDTCTVIVTA